MSVAVEGRIESGFFSDKSARKVKSFKIEIFEDQTYCKQA